LITVIDSGIGNFLSVVNMLKKIGYESILTDDYDLISKSKILIFPGVGNFDHVMHKIYEKKIDKAILNSLEKNSKLLGICVGMQALFTKSEEGELKGLNLINGYIRKFNFKNNNFKIPHMGWNEVKFNNKSVFSKTLANNKFYFVHSYFADCNDKGDILGITNYSTDFVSSVKKGNIYGVQFHPEKSHYFGKEFLKIFLETK
jgi:imidazole glycerol-phosphate synthase subunit HisH